jgi:hypothetical protein
MILSKKMKNNMYICSIIISYYKQMDVIHDELKDEIIKCDLIILIKLLSISKQYCAHFSNFRYWRKIISTKSIIDSFIAHVLNNIVSYPLNRVQYMYYMIPNDPKNLNNIDALMENIITIDEFINNCKNSSEIMKHYDIYNPKLIPNFYKIFTGYKCMLYYPNHVDNYDNLFRCTTHFTHLITMESDDIKQKMKEVICYHKSIRTIIAPNCDIDINDVKKRITYLSTATTNIFCPKLDKLLIVRKQNRSGKNINIPGNLKMLNIKNVAFENSISSFENLSNNFIFVALEIVNFKNINKYIIPIKSNTIYIAINTINTSRFNEIDILYASTCIIYYEDDKPIKLMSNSIKNLIILRGHENIKFEMY